MNQFILFKESKACAKCIYFLQKNNTFFCKKFGEKNIITGEINYVKCIDQRSYFSNIDGLCGTQGKYFVEKKK